MIRKFLLTLTIIFSAGAMASAASLYLGYCNGEIANTGTGKTGTATMSACMKLDAQTLAPYKGATITAVRVGLVTGDGVNNLTGWVRNNYKSSTDIDKGTVETAVTGWNRIPLEGGATIGSAPLYIGFDFEQSKSIKCISVVGKEREESFLMARNGTWETPREPKGILSVELEITSDKLPGTDLAVAYITPAPLTVKQGETVKVEFGIQNKALNTIKSFDYTCEFNGNQVHCGSSTNALENGSMFIDRFDIDTKNLEPNRNYPITISIKTDNDDNASNDIATGLVAVYEKTFERITLLEEFTTEKCPQCPRATNTINELERTELGPRIVGAAHHSAYYTDDFTTSEDLSWVWFFGDKGSYAPAALIDRTAPAGKELPVSSFGYLSDMRPLIEKALAVPAFVQLKINAEYDATTRTLKCNTVSEKLDALDVVCPDAKLNVWLVEDYIEPTEGGQAGNTDPDYYHRHVFRKSFTGVWGKDMKWDGNISQSSQFTAVFPKNWEASRVGIVAFVSEYSPVDRTGCRVFNAKGSGLEGSAITVVENDDINAPVEYYNLQGQRVEEPQHGIFIKKQGGKTSKCIK